MEAAGGAEEDWSQLPTDLLGLIVRRLDRLPDDHIRFGAVCEAWRAVVIQNRDDHLSLNQFPGLMVPDGTGKNSQTRRFLRFNHGTGLFEEAANSKLLQVPHRHVCRGSAYGWLFLTDNRLNTKLLNPFTGAEIQLPSAKTLPPASEDFNPLDKWYVFKAVFSSNPSLQPPPVVLVIHGGHTPRLAYCKPGDKAWMSLHSRDFNHYYMDAIFYKDQFYAVSYPGYIMAFDIGRRIDDNDESVKTTLIAPAPRGKVYTEQTYLVELLDGELIKIIRKIVYDDDDGNGNGNGNDDDDNDNEEEDEEEEEEEEDEDEDEDEDENDYTDANSDDDDDDVVDYADADEDTDYSEDNDDDDACREVFNFHTTGFEITKFKASKQKWVKVKNLGDNALFLGRNTSFSLPASEYPGCVPNSIYFTSDEVGHLSEDSGSDIGIYNLSDKSIKSLCPIGYSMSPCPIWVDSRGSTWVSGGSRCANRVLDHCIGGVSGNWIYSKSARIDDDDDHHVSFNQFPGLMVPGTDDNSETRHFLRLNHKNGSVENDCNDQLQVPHGYVCRGSAYGWVFLVGDELDTKLMNPFTGEQIQLPSVTTLPRASRGWIGINKWYVLKAVFSSNPSIQPAPLVLVIHQGHTSRLAYCKPGDKSWTSLHHRHSKHRFEDAIFYKDQFYALSHPGYIVAYDIGRRTDDDDHSVKKTLIASGPKGLVYAEQMYLVELDGELIKLTRKVRHRNIDGRCETCRFKIRRFVATENKWVEVESLGDNALFLGKNTSFSLRASEHPGCIPNAVYFTDRSTENFRCTDYGYDMGIYKLSDKSVMPLYPVGSRSTMPPPVWVTRVLHADI